MAYCTRCGAYIPDGQKVCLACGYDPDAEKPTSSQFASQSGTAAQQRGNEELRRRLEQQRQRSQEQNRQWAEQERQRREEQSAREEARRQKQEADRRWAEEEYEKRKAGQQSRAAYDEGFRAGREKGRAEAQTGNKALAALSYLSVLFALPYIFTPNDEYAKFHAKQGLKLFIFGIVADIAASLIGVGWIVTLARLYLIYKGMSNALSGLRLPLPWIGELDEK